jgi:tRNA uridine 5-carboxymethylaminomethyl modification enzyme
MTELSYRIGLASQKSMDKVIAKKEGVEQIKSILEEMSLEPDEINGFFEIIGSASISEKQKIQRILLRPGIEVPDLADAVPKLKDALSGYQKELIEQASIQIKYDVYIEKEKDLVQRMGQLEDLSIPENFDYTKLSSLSAEAMQKFKKIKPRTLGQASRISGVNPSDVQILMVYMGR